MMEEKLKVKGFDRKSQYISARIQSTLIWYEANLEHGLHGMYEKPRQHLKDLFMNADEFEVTELQFDSQCYVWRFRN